MRYGIPYQASKNRIARRLIDFLPHGEVFVDLFAGGCAVTHAAMESGKYRRFIANDLGEWPEIFRRAVAGEFKDWAFVPTREEFFATQDLVVRLLYSFGNRGKTYLWGREIEGVKVAASKMLLAPTWQERYKRYHDFIRELGKYKGNGQMRQLQRLQELEGLERLERLEGLEGLQGLERLEGLEISRLDYREVAIPAGAVVYADPPYRGRQWAEMDSKAQFDFEAFDAWLQGVDFPVFVSEYTPPAGCVEIAAWEKLGTMKSGSVKTVERLYVQERFAGEYGTLWDLFNHEGHEMEAIDE